MRAWAARSVKRFPFQGTTWRRREPHVDKASRYQTHSMRSARATALPIAEGDLRCDA